MLVCVPLPVCQTTSGKCSSSLPAMTSSAARIDRRRLLAGSAPRSRLTIAAAFLRIPKRADHLAREALAADRKCSSERSVCAPQ
jgi:hypothetical protein